MAETCPASGSSEAKDLKAGMGVFRALFNG